MGLGLGSWKVQREKGGMLRKQDQFMWMGLHTEAVRSCQKNKYVFKEEILQKINTQKNETTSSPQYLARPFHLVQP